jgi:OOP family OmpA-OmpF porin
VNFHSRLCVALGALALGACATTTSPPAGAPFGYVTDTRNAVVKDPYNLCWRTGYWTPAMAIIECDPDLVPKPVAAPAPPPPPAPAPAVVAPPPKPKRCDATVRVSADGTFAFDEAQLSPAGKALIDKDLMPRIQSCATVEAIIVVGHTDRIGSQAYNQKLSERRADAVKSYLVSKGIPAASIETLGVGPTQPVKLCPDADFKNNRKGLIECLKPNRRVEVDVRGPAK